MGGRLVELVPLGDPARNCNFVQVFWHLFLFRCGVSNDFGPFRGMREIVTFFSAALKDCLDDRTCRPSRCVSLLSRTTTRACVKRGLGLSLCGSYLRPHIIFEQREHPTSSMQKPGRILWSLSVGFHGVYQFCSMRRRSFMVCLKEKKKDDVWPQTSVGK